MTIASEITRIKTNIANAYAKAEEKGATVPEVKNSANLASCVETITTGGGGGSLSGIPKALIVDGVANMYSGSTTGLFDEVVTVGEKALQRLYESNKNITGSVSFPKLTQVDKNGLQYCFSYCTELTSADFSSLEVIYSSGLGYCFQACSRLTSVNFKSLKQIISYGLEYCFSYCTGLTSVNFDALEYVDSSGLAYAFLGCTGLTTISFPSLTTVYSLTNAFSQCTNITEIHFRADMETAIKKLTQYSTKFGATNATIYFDL